VSCASRWPEVGGQLPSVREFCERLKVNASCASAAGSKGSDLDSVIALANPEDADLPRARRVYRRRTEFSRAPQHVRDKQGTLRTTGWPVCALYASASGLSKLLSVKVLAKSLTIPAQQRKVRGSAGCGRALTVRGALLPSPGGKGLEITHHCT